MTIKQPIVHHRDEPPRIDCPFNHVQRIVTGGEDGAAQCIFGMPPMAIEDEWQGSKGDGRNLSGSCGIVSSLIPARHW